MLQFRLSWTQRLWIRLSAGAIMGFAVGTSVGAQEPRVPRESPGLSPSPMTQLAPIPTNSSAGTPGTLAGPPTVSEAAFQQPPTADYVPQGATPRGVQEAPGVPEFAVQSSPAIPEYVYQTSYFDNYDIGARPIADYAPSGYEAREFQDAPGAPEFTPIGPSAPVTPAERQRYVVRGIYPGSFLAPGTNTSFRLRGFVRLTGLYDMDPIGSRDDFVTNTIPVPQQSGQNFNMSARPSRFALETWTPTSFHEWNVHTFIEGDFFNGPAQAVGGGGNPFRLRFAFVDFGYFRVGQQNSVFMDGNAWPSTVDFAGPRGLLNQRRPGARVTLPLYEESFFWAAGVEQPFSDITTNRLGTNYQDVPDFASHFRYESDYGHLQLSGIARAIGYQPTGGQFTRRGGWGFSASTVFHPWAILLGRDPVRSENPSGLERSRILAQYSFGTGIARYIQDTAGLGLDGQVDPATGGFDTCWATGYTFSYEHWFNEHWLTNVTYSGDAAATVPGQIGGTYVGAKYLAASLWWIPMRNMSIGVEYLWGERENLDNQTGRANRINSLFQYNF
jgi:hypothetical protein